MKWFKKNKDHKRVADDAIAAMLATVLVRLQTKLIARLQKLEARLSLRQRKLALLVFCLLFGLANIWILGKVMFGDVSDAAIYRQQIPPVAQPPPYKPSDSATTKLDNRYYLDSINIKPLNRK
jgi:hypothetical protein